MQINDMDLQDLKPESLAQMLAVGNPKLVSSWFCMLNIFRVDTLMTLSI